MIKYKTLDASSPLKRTPSDKKLTKEKAKLLQLEAFARRLDRRIAVER